MTSAWNVPVDRHCSVQTFCNWNVWPISTACIIPERNGASGKSCSMRASAAARRPMMNLPNRDPHAPGITRTSPALARGPIDVLACKEAVVVEGAGVAEVAGLANASIDLYVL